MTNSTRIIEISFRFSLQILKLCRLLNEEKEYVLAKQLLRSGTSIGANIEEATAGQSRKDFLNKMSIASKEARETQYWLRLLNDSGISKIDFTPYLNEIRSIVNILTSIVKTTKETLN